MPLIILYLGDEYVRRFSTVDAAKEEGGKSHSSAKPARIEVTPEGGGPIIAIEYDPDNSNWVTA
jgi:hypothetical protein